jgi:hypothetical protein
MISRATSAALNLCNLYVPVRVSPKESFDVMLDMPFIRSHALPRLGFRRKRGEMEKPESAGGIRGTIVELEFYSDLSPIDFGRVFGTASPAYTRNTLDGTTARQTCKLNRITYRLEDVTDIRMSRKLVGRTG